jgi:hypothetical protein
MLARLVGVAVLGLVVACGPGKPGAQDAGSAGDGPAGDAGLTRCGSPPYSPDSGVIINGVVYCVDGSGTMCCLVLDEGGFGSACIPEAAECPPLNHCRLHPGDLDTVCLLDEWCLDNGRYIAGCSKDCVAPQEPCGGGTGCCTEAAYCSPDEGGCVPREDAGNGGPADAGQD